MAMRDTPARTMQFLQWIYRLLRTVDSITPIGVSLSFRAAAGTLQFDTFPVPCHPNPSPARTKTKMRASVTLANIPGQGLASIMAFTGELQDERRLSPFTSTVPPASTLFLSFSPSTFVRSSSCDSLSLSLSSFLFLLSSLIVLCFLCFVVKRDQPATLAIFALNVLLDDSARRLRRGQRNDLLFLFPLPRTHAR